MISKKYRVWAWAGLLIAIIAATQWVAEKPAPEAQNSSNANARDYLFVSYHKEPPKGPLPATLSPAEFKGDPTTRACYRMAGETKEILYQLPCLCACDKSEGHKSLHDCFTSKHGQYCEVCKKEAAYAYRESRKGAPIEQIRQGVMQGAWRDINLNDFALLGLDSVSQQERKQRPRGRP